MREWAICAKIVRFLEQTAMTDLPALIALVKRSKILSPEERQTWLRRMERMNEQELQQLKEILLRGGQHEGTEGVSVQTIVPELTSMLDEAQAAVDHFRHTSHGRA